MRKTIWNLKSVVLPLGAIVLVSLMSGCASITGTSHQRITVQTFGQEGREVRDAACLLTNFTDTVRLDGLAPANYPEQDDHDGYDQENVDKAAHGVGTHQAQEPQDNQNNGDRIKHIGCPYVIRFALFGRGKPPYQAPQNVGSAMRASPASA